MKVKGRSTDELINLLEKTRKKEGKTQADLAKRFGVSRQTYSNWVRGTNQPSGDNKAKIKGYLATAESREVEQKFREAEGIVKTKLLWATLPEDKWNELEKLEDEKDESVVTDALEKYLEDTKVKVG